MIKKFRASRIPVYIMVLLFIAIISSILLLKIEERAKPVKGVLGYIISIGGTLIIITMIFVFFLLQFLPK